MKNYFFAIFVLLAFLFQSCKSSTEINLSSYSKSTIDVMNNYNFPSGTYYKYNFSSYNENIDAENELEKFLKENIIIEQAWYRSPLNGCSPPGAGWTTRAMYPATFLVLLRNSDDEISDEKYSKLTNNPNISCGYDVINYRFND